MGKVVIFLSLVSLVILQVGSMVLATSPIMWLASATVPYEVVRGVLAILLLALLVTHPPRQVALRTLVGLTAAGVLVSALWLTYANQMLLLDSLSMSAAGVSMAIAAFELNDSEQQATTKALHGPKKAAFSS
jgi:hypothetical protein